jgi:ABC-2 type transport system permease protein
MPKSALELFWKSMMARTYPRVAWMFRHRTWLIQETLLPILSVVALSNVYKWMGAPVEYVGIVILGAAMTAFWLNVLWSLGGHLYWERDSGNLELYILSPAPMMGILAGMALGGLTMTIVRAAAIVGTGVLLFDVPLNPSSWWLLALVFALTMLALYGLGMMFASVFLLFGREAYHTVNLLQEPIYLMTGMNFPLTAIEKMTHWALPAAAMLIPLAAGMDAMRQVLFPPPESGPVRFQGFLGLEYEVPLLAVMSVVFMLLAKRFLDVLERKAKEEGKLTVKWQ